MPESWLQEWYGQTVEKRKIHGHGSSPTTTYVIVSLHMLIFSPNLQFLFFRFDCTSNQWTPLNIRGGISQRSWQVLKLTFFYKFNLLEIEFLRFSMSSFGGSRQRVLYLLGGAYLGPGLQRNTGQFDVYEIDAKRWREVDLYVYFMLYNSEFSSVR